MRLPPPTPPPYDPFEWRAAPWASRVKQACQAWVLDGYGAPLAIYSVYLVKLVLYVALWVWFCGFNAGGAEAAGWWFTADAFKKAILWSMAFESLGLGCGSGPLTGRYLPPVAAPLHFLRPGTLKLPFRGDGRRRTALDVLLYLAHMLWLFRVLLAPSITPQLLLPTVLGLGLLGWRDRTIFIASRAEHYGAMLVCFLFVDDWIAGAIAVQLAIWWWAAVSKLNHHFPSVVSVMMSNSPWMRSRRLRTAFVRDFPEDLRPSKLAVWAAHGGTALEFLFPALLLAGDGGALTVVGLGVMLLFHSYITSNVPMAVPLEWNVVVVYGALFLFGHHASVDLLDIGSPLLIGFLSVVLIGVPLLGNRVPSAVSFLMSMRYYAGNWPYSIWLFRGESAQILDAKLCKASAHPEVQLAHFYDERTIVGIMGKVIAFRSMHLHGRALPYLMPKAVDDVEAYTPVEGEIIAGLVLGYNFGDGHQHDVRLLRAVQAECGFAPGELRHVFVEAQPLGGATLRWQIHDAATGLVDEGELEVAALRRCQPWSVASATGS